MIEDNYISILTDLANYIIYSSPPSFVKDQLFDPEELVEKINSNNANFIFEFQHSKNQVSQIEMKIYLNQVKNSKSNFNFEDSNKNIYYKYDICFALNYYIQAENQSIEFLNEQLRLLNEVADFVTYMKYKFTHVFKKFESLNNVEKLFERSKYNLISKLSKDLENLKSNEMLSVIVQTDNTCSNLDNQTFTHNIKLKDITKQFSISVKIIPENKDHEEVAQCVLKRVY